MTWAVDLPTPSMLWSRPALANASRSSSGTSLIARAAPRKARTLYVSAPLRSRRNAIWLSASSGCTTSYAFSFLARLGATRGGSSGILGYCGGHGASCSPASLSRSAMASSGSIDCGGDGDVGPRVAPLGHQLGHGADGEVVGDDRLDLIPGERRGHLAPDPGPGEPGAEHGLVRRVLVEVDEDAGAALLLPPLGGDLVGMTALELAGEGDCGGPDGDGVPTGLEPQVHVQPVAARGLGVAAQAQLVEQVLALQRGGPDLVEADPLGGVEVDAELVGVLGVGRHDTATDAGRGSRS